MEFLSDIAEFVNYPLTQFLLATATMIGGVSTIFYFVEARKVEEPPARFIEQMFLNSLKINQALGRQDSLAKDYADLGNFYKRHGKIKKSEAMYLKSVQLYKELGDSHADMVQRWLEEIKAGQVTSMEKLV